MASTKRTGEITTLDEKLRELYPDSPIPQAIDQVDIIVEMLRRERLPVHEQRALKLLLDWYHSRPRFRIEAMPGKRIHVEINAEMSLKQFLLVLGATGLGGLALALLKVLGGA
jgi:hypothetical protein